MIVLPFKVGIDASQFFFLTSKTPFKIRSFKSEAVQSDI